MVKRISPLASNEKFQVRFLVELLTIDCRVGVHGNAKVVGSIPTDATFI
jgi:hypothetical protein